MPAFLVKIELIQNAFTPVQVNPSHTAPRRKEKGGGGGVCVKKKSVHHMLITPR